MKKSIKIKENSGRKAFLFFNSLILFLLVIVCFYPIYYVLIASMSNPGKLMAEQGAMLLPAGMDFSSYKAVLKNQLLFVGYRNTIIVIIGGLALNMSLTIIAGYFFSRRNVMHQKFFMLMMVFTMFFSGGLIPTYLMMKGIGLEDNLLVLILLGAINSSNVLIMRTAFYNIPQSLEESVRIDGGGHFRTLVSVVIPLSLPTIAVICLYYTVGHWNSWFNASIYIRNKNLYPLQLVLREILIENETSSMDADSSIADKVMIADTIKYAIIVVSTVPILAIYPFLQKFFVNGVMIGAVKG